MEETMKRTWRQGLGWAIALVVTLSAPALGQQARRGEITGSITDNTGAFLPGVTVTVISPALQVPSIVRIADERGNYQVPELPTGTYAVTYELAGFGTLVREGIVLTSGFTARLDVEMTVAALSETITVAGQSPVVDVTSTRGGTTVSKELLAVIPSNNNFRDLFLMVGGLHTQDAPQVGMAKTAANGFPRNSMTYGEGKGASIVEGMKR